MFKSIALRPVLALLAVAVCLPVIAQQLSPDWTRCVNQGNAFSPDERIGGCMAVLRSERETAANRAIAHHNRGSAYHDKKDFDRAIADYSEAIRLNPSYAAAYHGRGAAHGAKGDNDRAIADHNEAIRLNPNLFQAYNNRGNAYWAKGNNDLAIADYNDAIRLNPSYGDAYLGRGFAHDDKGDYDRAIADHTRAIEIDPKKAGAYFSRGIVRFYNGDFKEASVDLLRALEMRDNAYPMLFRFLARARAGEDAGPELEANTARLKTRAWPFAGIELLAGKRTPEATLPAATKAEEICEAHFCIGEWHLLKGEKDAAAKSLQTAVDTCLKTFVEYRAAAAELT